MKRGVAALVGLKKRKKHSTSQLGSSYMSVKQVACHSENWQRQQFEYAVCGL